MLNLYVTALSHLLRYNITEICLKHGQSETEANETADEIMILFADYAKSVKNAVEIEVKRGKNNDK